MNGNQQEMINQKVAVACINANGMADVFVTEIQVTQENLELGVHYDVASRDAEDAGYEAPFVCFDEAEIPALLKASEFFSRDNTSNVSADTTAELLPSATEQEIREVMMKDVVGDYEVPGDVPEWAWIESNACFSHVRNGQDGIWEFVLNLSNEFTQIPEKLAPVIAKANADCIAYLMFHQGT